MFFQLILLNQLYYFYINLKIHNNIMSYIEIQLPKNNKIAKEHLKKYSLINNIHKDYEKRQEKEEEFNDIIKHPLNRYYENYISSVGISKKQPITKAIKEDQIILIIELNNILNDDYEDFINFCKEIINKIYKNEGLYFCIYHIYNTDLYYKWYN